MKSILDYETVALIDEDDAIEIIDQTLLPGTTKIIRLHTGQEIWDAIYLLQVRGAPAIGVSAGFGLYLLMKHSKAGSYEEFCAELKEKSDFLNSSRPTAVNLSWALKRMEKHAADFYETELKAAGSFEKVREKLIAEMRAECERIKAEDIEVCRKIGEYGVTLVKDGDGLLTHCNAGQLCACKYGTATAPMYLAHEKGMNIKVYCDETRPLLQGARLTAYELHSAGIDTTLLCDNMSASLMRTGAINAIFVGCDRVAANGDAANKIGTSMVALAAKRYNVPFYVCAPTSTIDINTPTGADIKIEQRKPEEVTEMWYKERMAPEGIGVYNPAFDVTDNELITGIVTEYGILRAPYDVAIKELFNKE
ncbi:S-methyl-5-thioribose-1-phosphate isomerase [Butyrivibrio sp. DSM 10294]|uniref:S-methyl-5-thioribose-1-phosphate isomerase n=1 Tax=Butyrivibrio sp. DSM 10294 TaxID=2972457 RepID=UPI00234ECC4E|nr:S-methyl-5-thioribose-1-phosphate isomerase [Butyrivibrio sp. DSM 10294]MDC7294933.1 S-methyl-5-thioribose-1-phosphate isomerase [Butyrivibrio sp. DSM 10294]